MKLDDAIKLLKEKYRIAKENPQISDALSYALYKTWREVDNKHKQRRKRCL